MYGFVSTVSLASLAFFSSVEALPFEIDEYKFYGHGDSVWNPSSVSSSSSSSYSSPCTESTFPTLSLDASAFATANPSEYLTGSGSVRPYPTASGYAWPSGTGYSSPTGSIESRKNSSTNSVSTLEFTTASSTALPSTLRGANIGGWLVLEEWMTSDFFEGTSATDQWSFDETEGASTKLQAHWSSYFNESDVAQLASWGINAVRIPIGYWAYNNTGTPYIQGADAYLEQAIEWCRSYGIKVLVDCHGSPGSQNGFDNSGRSGIVAWQSDDNLELSIEVLKTIATKYGTTEYADVVFGIEIVNEPISWDQNNFTMTQQWAQDAYWAIKSVATNPSLNVIMHDAFMGPSEWEAIGASINGDSTLEESNFWIDVHLYQNQETADSLLTQDQHIQAACNWSSSELLPSSSNLPVIVGEFSMQTNICANPDGSTLAGSACYIDGCQCDTNVDVEYWNEPLVNATRMFVEAELDTFEQHSRGWFVWSYKGPGAWGLTNAVEYGLIGSNVTDRAFPNQCSSTY